MTDQKTPYKAFCEMLRHESAKPLVARIQNFVERLPSGLSRYEAADQVHNFLTQCEKLMFAEIVVFMADADEQGMQNACESLEKFLICKLYAKVFDIDTTDAEEDVKLKEKLSGLSWVEPKHLGIPDINRSLWPLCIEELQKINGFKAPADKLTCVVNTCHVVNDVLKRTQAEIGGSRPLSADDFLPLLIYAIIRANPARLHSNAEFIGAFRHPSRLGGEHAYWVTMFSSAKEFLRDLGHATLEGVSEEEYNKRCTEALEAADYNVAPSVSSTAPPSSAAKAPEPQAAEPPQAASSSPTDATKNQVQVYGPLTSIASSSSSSAHKSAEWTTMIWSGRLKASYKEKDLAIKMIDRSTGSLFAECVIPCNEYRKYVEPVCDSQRSFVVKISHAQREAFIGIKFQNADEGAKFQKVLGDFEKETTNLDPFGAVQTVQGSPTTATSDTSNANGYPEQDKAIKSSLDMISFDAPASQPCEPESEPTPGVEDGPPQAHLSDPFADMVDMMKSSDASGKSIPLSA